MLPTQNKSPSNWRREGDIANRGGRYMRGLADIQLDVRGGDIIVDLPGTDYTVTYHKPAVSPQLLAVYTPAKDDARTQLTQAEFLARAWRLANDKARELGWIA